MPYALHCPGPLTLFSDGGGVLKQPTFISNWRVKTPSSNPMVVGCQNGCSLQIFFEFPQNASFLTRRPRGRDADPQAWAWSRLSQTQWEKGQGRVSKTARSLGTLFRTTFTFCGKPQQGPTNPAPQNTKFLGVVPPGSPSQQYSFSR